MTCDYCATDSGTYALSRLCCAVRFTLRDCHGTDDEIRDMRTKTAEVMQTKYGHSRDAMLEEAKQQRARRLQNGNA